jgi:hypothetical protein
VANTADTQRERLGKRQAYLVNHINLSVLHHVFDFRFPILDFRFVSASRPDGESSTLTSVL